MCSYLVVKGQTVWSVDDVHVLVSSSIGINQYVHSIINHLITNSPIGATTGKSNLLLR